MKIVHFLLGRCNPESANGVDKTVYYLSKEQAKLGHEVTILSITDKKAIPVPGCLVKIYKSYKVPFMVEKRLFKDIREFRPDIVHLHSVYIPQNAVVSLWLYKNKIPYVVTPHGGLSPLVMKRNRLMKIVYKYLFELPILNNAFFVHSVGDTESIKKYGVSSPIVEVPNAFDMESIPKNINPELLSEMLPESKGKRVFLFLGRLDPQHKGLDLFLRAFAKCRIDNSIFILVGPDWNGGKIYLEKLIESLQLRDKVFIIGPVYGKNKFSIIQSADIFVHTSRWEGLPFAVLEAMAMKKPCLLTPPADPCGFASSNKSAVVVEPNVESVSIGIEKFLSMSNEDLEQMGNRGQALIMKEFNWAHITKLLIEAYRGSNEL